MSTDEKMGRELAETVTDHGPSREGPDEDIAVADMDSLNTVDRCNGLVPSHKWAYWDREPDPIGHPVSEDSE